MQDLDKLIPGHVRFEGSDLVHIALVEQETWNGWERPLVRLSDDLLDEFAADGFETDEGFQVEFSTPPEVFPIVEHDGDRWVDFRDGGLCWMWVPDAWVEDEVDD